MSSRTSEKVRELTASALGLIDVEGPAADMELGEEPAASIGEDDEVLEAVKAAHGDGYAGAILSGVPGTGKSWYAASVAGKMTEDDPSRVTFIQFHPSYQYEDFIEGFVPESGGFERKLRLFGQLCEDASEDPDRLYVLVIDEISRTDVARVFGEALTYIETSKRDITFRLASGTELAVPKNIFIIATMNPWDRGVDELDVALERRFALIDMPPDTAALRKILERNGAPDALLTELSTFFAEVQASPSARAHIGHAYFNPVRDLASLQRLWRFQLGPFFEKALRSQPEELRRLRERWSTMVGRLSDAPA